MERLKSKYCVAIRTLGKSGAKYQRLLDSLQQQTIKPNKILVYLPYGYEAPKETIGIEQIIRCEKGMVAQRSLLFEEINTQYVMFCDDDMYLAPHLAETLLKAMETYHADSITPTCYSEMSFYRKVVAAIYNFSFPRISDNWALKVTSTAGYTYNIHPKHNILRTQTAAGGCIFCDMDALHTIHFEDERWLDKFMFAALDDQLFHYKLHINGYKTFMYYTSDVVHLDARSATRPDVTKKIYYKWKNLYIVWYRSVYMLKKNSKLDKFLIASCFTFRMFIAFLSVFVDIVRHKKLNFLTDFFKAIRDAKRYVKSEEYLKIPPYDAYIKKKI